MSDKERWFLNNWCDSKGSPGKAHPCPPPEPTGLTEFPWGYFEVYADDDEVIGLSVAVTRPHGYHIVRTDPPFMDAFDEPDVAVYLAWALTHRDTIRGLWGKQLAPPAGSGGEQTP